MKAIRCRNVQFSRAQAASFDPIHPFCRRCCRAVADWPARQRAGWRITDGDPADLDVVELLARREWDRLEFTRRAGLLIVRPMNGSSRGGVSVYSDDVTDSDAFFDPPTPLGVVRRDGACPTRPWLLESDYLDQRRHATLEDALRELADDLGR